MSNNIQTLRKCNGLTQIDLAKKINFSDKAVSRWEKGEVMPDIETLQDISHVFGVPISYLLEEHPDDEYKSKRKISRNDIILQLLLVCVVWVFITILFVYLKIIENYYFWQAFVWGVPITTIISLHFNRKWGFNVLKAILRTVLVWSTITGVYLQFLHLNLWLIFLIGAPIQAAIIVAAFAKPKLKDF